MVADDGDIFGLLRVVAKGCGKELVVDFNFCLPEVFDLGEGEIVVRDRGWFWGLSFKAENDEEDESDDAEDGDACEEFALRVELRFC